MQETFDALEYLSHLRQRWKFLAACAVSASVLAAIVCALLTPRFTATAKLVIEPPAGSDPRAATAISAVYLESLKSYEDFASSDTLFARAVEKFGITGNIDALKSRVLRVNKPKDTKVLEISATLPDPQKAQALAQFLAEQTVALNLSVARSGEGESLRELNKQLDDARSALETARNEQTSAEAGGSESVIDSELRNLAELKFRTAEQLISANALLAEQNGADVATSRARIAALEKEKLGIEREESAKRAALTGLRAKMLRAEDHIRAAQSRFDLLSQRTGEMSAQSGTRTEQLRLIDPGVVPQQPSFPRTSLIVIGAFLAATVLGLVWVTLLFGMSRQRTHSFDTELRVARGGR